MIHSDLDLILSFFEPRTIGPNHQTYGYAVPGGRGGGIGGGAIPPGGFVSRFGGIALGAVDRVAGTNTRKRVEDGVDTLSSGKLLSVLLTLYPFSFVDRSNSWYANLSAVQVKHREA